MTLAMISTVSDLTPLWFTELLRSTGDLDEGSSVSAVEAAPFGGEESMMSSLFRVALTFDTTGETASEAPASLIVKLASTNDTMRFVAGMFRFYEREIRFYNELLSGVPIDTPRCLHAEMYPDDHGFVLVLEEVTGYRQVDQIAGMNFSDATTTLEALADLHIPNWGAELTDISETMIPFGSDILQQLVPPKVADDWVKVRPMVADDLPAEVIDVLDRIVEIFPTAMNDLMGHDTIVHGDCRADNMLFDDNGDVLMLDFQLMAVCNGMFDTSYLISQSLDEAAQERADELIQVYLARIAAGGIEVDSEQAMIAYRAGTIFHMSIALGILSADGMHERSEKLGRLMLDRAAREVIRTDAHVRYAKGPAK